MADKTVRIDIGMGSCGIAGGARDVEAAVRDEVRRTGAEARVRAVGCCGMCFAEPLVEVHTPEGRRITYGGVPPEVARRIVNQWAPPATALDRARLGVRGLVGRLRNDTAWLPIEAFRLDLERGEAGDYVKHQKRIVLDRCGVCDPVSIDDYCSVGGYSALEKVLRELTPEEVIEQITASGLRGRGGGGFPTGKKWRLAADAEADKKFIICNGDEGDPGAFMDRALLESDSHRVLEGIAIAAWAVGADEAYLFVRAEYPLAVKRMREAIAAAEAAGRLGHDINGTGFDLTVHVFASAGAFVCGEETALIASIEGCRGIPRVRPPYPTEHGLWGKPTLVNNVETFACVPWIINRGPEAFAAIGTESSKGTKVFALAGQINRGGLIEAPMGMTIREIVEKIGGGIIGGRRFKAVQIGGPAGGCLPAELADTPIDYDALTETGTIMGSGGLVVLDDMACMVDFARFFLPFTQHESCGKCTFCRIGSKRMLETLNRLCEGEGKPEDLERLEELGHLMREASFCGLGKNAPNPVLTSLRYFREEYEAHIAGRCPAGKCKALIQFSITDKCIGCTLCAQSCPSDAIEPRPYERHEIDQEKCIRCGMCKLVCPEEAVEVE